MIANSFIQFTIYLILLLLLARPLGIYMARVYQGERVFLGPLLRPLERGIYRLAGIQPDLEMDWKRYTLSMLAFSLLGFIVLLVLLLIQRILPLNPEHLGSFSPDLAFNTAMSFVTNTNWQSYAGEITMSYLSQMLGLTVQNFLSAATGMAVLVAFIRGLFRHTSQEIGNFWVDLTRSVIYILLPLALILAFALISQGVVQSLKPYQIVTPLQTNSIASDQRVNHQTIAIGPAASQVAIKQLGTNGGGFFNVNSAHPFENPTPLSNFLETLAILLIPAALCFTFGAMVGDMRQGWAIFITMTLIFITALSLTWKSETSANPAWAALGVDQSPTPLQAGGNMEGKETRFGITDSTLWAVATTAASNGSVNSMHDSYTATGGMISMWLIQLGEVVYGGVGSGLYGMLAFVIIAVFVAGLMVGRTPEYLGKKIESFEMKMASLMILIPVLLVLFGTAAAVSDPAMYSAVHNPGPHGFSEILYAYSSAGNNNGSAFAGLDANRPFFNLSLGIAMLIGRFGVMIPALAIAGSLAAKKKVPPGAGTLPTHTPLFIVWLIGVILLIGALSFIPALALGPIVEALS